MYNCRPFTLNTITLTYLIEIVRNYKKKKKHYSDHLTSTFFEGKCTVILILYFDATACKETCDSRGKTYSKTNLNLLFNLLLLKM